MVSFAGSAAGVIAEPPTAGDRELKFSLPAGRLSPARRWLQTVCRPDRDHPRALVSTIYYDTPDLRSLGEKINSDYLKLKVRLRWYSDLEGTPSGPAFVEAKFREGTLRGKVRVPLSVAADVVAGWALHDPRLRSLPLLLRPHGITLRGAWQPMLLLRYRRDRFVDPTSRARISLDAEIAAVAANRRFVAIFDGTPLGTGVLEVKGGAEQLPMALRSLLRLGARQGAFSKYAAVFRQVTRSTA